MTRSTRMLAGVVLLSISFSAEAANKKYLMGAIGDSITAGVMANTRLDGRPGVLTPEQAFEGPQARINEHPELSWSGGDQISSHFAKLRTKLRASGDDLELLNVAVTGSRAVAMEGQAQQVANAIASGKYEALKYLTFLVGANDACATDTPVGTDNERMAQSLDKAYAVIASIKQNEPIHILVPAFPNIPMLGIDEIRRHSSAFGISCNNIWDGFFHICTPMLNWKNIAERDARIQIVETKNELIKAAALRAAAKYPNLQIAFSDAVFKHEITTSFVAGDCFHPNKTGQQALADELWRDQPWF